MDVEGHGREDVFNGVDLSRTVGWFTCMYPVRFSLAASPQDALCGVKERTRAVPARGLGYGVLRYLSSDPDLKNTLDHAAPDIGFNFLGEFRTQSGDVAFRLAHDASLGGRLCVCGTRPHRLNVEADITSGKLRVSFIYSRNLNKRERIERLAQAFESSLRELFSQSVPVLTTADFATARMGREDFDRLFQRISNSR